MSEQVTYTTIPALAQPKVSKTMKDMSGNSKLVGALMKKMGKKKMKKQKMMMPGMKGMHEMKDM